MTFLSARGLVVLCLFATSAIAQNPEQGEALLSNDLSNWETYLGYPNTQTSVADVPRSADGDYAQPIGYGRDEWNVFSVDTSSGEPVLRISGEIYGGLFTRRDYGNYHLRLQVKWGEQKWHPRKDLPLDSGILYHGTGEHGVDYWRAWPLSQEFQIVQQGVDGTTGDWWKIAHSQIDIRCQSSGADQPYQFDPEVALITFGGDDGVNTCRAGANYEKPAGEWNTLDLITYEDKSLHIVNGKVAMALSNSAYPEDGKVIPLTRGKIVLQSEAGEVFYRRIHITPIEGIPEEYQRYFQ